MPDIDLSANRQAVKWTKRELLVRLLWELAQPLFRWSPRPLWGWRRWLLKRFGARVGACANIFPSARIMIPWNLEIGDWGAIGESAIIYNLARIKLGRATTVSQYAHLCAGSHDYADPALPLLKPPITVGDQVWICAEAFVGPNVSIGEGAVVGARSVVVRDVAAWTVVAGNPANAIKARTLRTSVQTAIGSS